MPRRNKQSDEMRKQGYILASEAAEFLGYHATSIYKLLDKGTLQEAKVGNTKYVSVASMIAFLGENSVQLFTDIIPRTVLAECKRKAAGMSHTIRASELTRKVSPKNK